MTPSPHQSPEGRTFQETVATLGQRALDAADLQTFLDAAVPAIADSLGVEYLSVFERRAEQDGLLLRDGLGWREGLIGTATLPHERGTHLDRTLQSETPINIDDDQTEDGFLSDHGIVDGISVAIGPVEDPWGVLGAYTADQREFTDADLEFLEHAASVLGSAVDSFQPESRAPEEPTERATETERDRIVRAMETTGNAISLIDGNGEFRYVNDAYAGIYGYEPAELLGKHWEELCPDDEASEISDEALPALAEQGTWAGETVGRRKDGTTFLKDLRLAAIGDGEFVCSARDVTTEQEQRQQLEAQEAALRETYEVISDQSRSFEEKVDTLLGIGRETIGTDYASFSHVEGQKYTFEVVRAADDGVQQGDVVPLSATNCERAIETRETLVLENIAEEAPALKDKEGNAEGGIACYLGAPVFVGDDVYGSICFYGKSPRERSFTDWQVTWVDLLSRWISYELERKADEHALEEYREYTDSILDAVDDVFYVLGRNGDLQRWNAALSNVTGYSNEEIEAMNAIEFFREADHVRITNAIHEGFDTGQARVEAEFRTKAGETIPYEFVAAALESPEGDQVLAGIGRDITIREEQQQALEASNERLEQFAYAASHDLQEPLRMITSYLQLIDERYGGALDEDGQEFLEFAVDGADRMRAMIDALLDYSRVDTQGGAFERVDLEAVLENVLDDLQLSIEENDAEICVGQLPEVEGDPSQLRQVFQNLLSNAILYSGDEPPEIDVAATRRDSEWVISVEDAGIGIEPENQERVFNVFDRLHSREEYEGTGIGLALCRRIVERHGGEIWIESEAGEGSAFYFTFPDSD